MKYSFPIQGHRLRAATRLVLSVSIGFMVASAVLPSVALAKKGSPSAPESKSADATSRTREGFWWRFWGGLAYNYASSSDAEWNIKASGFGLSFGTMLGYALTDDMILHLGFLTSQTVRPTVTASKVLPDGTTLQLIKESEGSLAPVLFGLGATRYFSNSAYLTGTLGVAGVQLGAVDTSAGWGFNLMTGFEGVSFSPQWRNGVAFQLAYTGVAQSDSGDPWIHTLVVGLVGTFGYK